MFFHKSKAAKTVISIFLLSACLLCAGCMKVESHREFPSESTQSTTAPQEPVVDTRPRVALTFDDGPSSITTKPIVDELDKYGYHATFFVVGNRVRKTTGEDYGGEAMIYAAEHGNEIGIHGYTHTANYASCSEETYQYEVLETLAAIQEKIPGYEVRVMRPIGGSISGTRVAESQFAIVNWNIDTLDWELRSPAGDAESIETIVNNALKDIEDGDIILMHDIYNNTYEATVIILQRLNEMGYNVVTVSELLGDTLEAGVRYTHGPKGAQ